MPPPFWCGECRDISGAPGSPLCGLCGVGTSRRRNYFRPQPRAGARPAKMKAPRPVNFETEQPKLLEG